MWGVMVVLALGAAEDPAEAEELEGIELVEELDELDQSSTWYGDAYAQADRVLDLLTARAARPGSFVFVVAHRNRQPIADDPFHSFLGFDGGGLKIGLGLRYGIFGGLDVGIYRLNGTIETFDTWELDARYQLLDQTRHGVDVAARAGLSWFVHPDREDALGGFGQLLIDRVVAERLLVGGGVLFHSDSSGDRKSTDDTGHSLALAAFAEFRFLNWLAWSAETSINLAGYGESYPTLSTAAKLYTHRHSFAITLSNTQYITADGIIANTRRGAIDQIVLGFNITREL